MARFTTFATAIAVSLCMLGPGALPAVAEPSPDAIESATTASDHLALARSYEEQAKRLRERAELHRKMGKRYRRVPLYRKSGVGATGMEKHCERLAASLEEAAREAESLAEAHRQLAASTSPEK